MEFFKDNLINWLFLAAVVVWMWNKFMPGVFGARRQKIQAAIDESARAKQEGEVFLQEQKNRIANAEKEADRILIEARETATQMKEQILKDAKEDAAKLQHKMEQQISAHRQMVITELRSQAAVAALRLAEIELPAALSDDVKRGLQERFINQLDQLGNN